MPSLLRLALVAALSSGILLALVFVALSDNETEASHTGGMDAMSIDVDVAGNTGTSLSPRESCVEAQPGDAVTVDVTATNIPATTAMIAFAYTILYDESRVWVEARNHYFLLAANSGSGVSDFSDPAPDQNFNGVWSGAAFDVSDWLVVPPEYGSGVLSRLSISISQGAPDGMYTLTLTDAGHIDTKNQFYLPDVLNDAVIAVGVSCPPVAGTPPPPTPTPLPTPTPMVPAISVSLDPEAQLRPQDGSVTIRGRVTCSNPGPVYLEVAVQQSVKTQTVTAAAPNSDPITCNGQASWSATVRPEYGAEYGRFRPGDAEAVVVAFGVGVGGVGASGPIYLKPGAVK